MSRAKKLASVVIKEGSFPPVAAIQSDVVYAVHQNSALGQSGPQAAISQVSAERVSWAVLRRGSVAVMAVDFAFWHSSYYDMIASWLSSAMMDPAVRSVVISFNSPGGTLHGCDDFAALIRQMTATKPIIAHVTGMACSAAYLLASACQRIVTGAAGEVGCLGVMTTFVDDREWQEKTGIRYRRVVSSQTPNKNMDPATEPGLAQLQANLDRHADIFLGAVARYRGVSISTVLQDYGAGADFVGLDAVAAGMADEVGTLENTIQRMNNGELLMPKSKGLTAGALYVATSDEDLEAFAVTAESLAAREDTGSVLTAAAQTAHAAAVTSAEADKSAAVENAATAERKRVADLLALSQPGAEAAIDAAIKSGATAAETAIAILAAMKDKGVSVGALRADATSTTHASSGATGRTGGAWDKAVARANGTKR